MKTIYLSLFTMLLFLTACEKDSGDETTTTSSSGYVLKAPSCLITHGYTVFGDVSFFYDSQKRLVKQSTSHDSDITTYSYSGNTMLETNTYIAYDGSIDTYNILHYLNAAGLVDSSVEEYSGLSYATIYQYNSQGYLVRSYKRDALGRVRPYFSYQYSNGNRVADYRISTDWQGQAIDSVIDISYTYHTDINGALEEWSAWTSRNGRASKNEIKTMQSGSYSETHTILLGTNNLPSQIDVQSSDGDYSLTLTWKCF